MAGLSPHAPEMSSPILYTHESFPYALPHWVDESLPRRFRHRPAPRSAGGTSPQGAHRSVDGCVDDWENLGGNARVLPRMGSPCVTRAKAKRVIVRTSRGQRTRSQRRAVLLRPTKLCSQPRSYPGGSASTVVADEPAFSRRIYRFNAEGRISSEKAAVGRPKAESHRRKLPFQRRRPNLIGESCRLKAEGRISSEKATVSRPKADSHRRKYRFNAEGRISSEKLPFQRRRRTLIGEAPVSASKEDFHSRSYRFNAGATD